MCQLIRTDSDNIDFKKLIIELDAYLKIINGNKNSFFIQYNKIDLIKHVVVVYINNKPVGCGAIKEYDKNTIEIKRMFVKINYRGKGIANNIINALEKWSIELGYKRCILETSNTMLDAIELYKKNGFNNIPKYGQYLNIDSSVCFEKMI